MLIAANRATGGGLLVVLRRERPVSDQLTGTKVVEDGDGCASGVCLIDAGRLAGHSFPPSSARSSARDGIVTPRTCRCVTTYSAIPAPLENPAVMKPSVISSTASAARRVSAQ